MLGAVQPLGTTRVSEPLFIPPAAAVYVNVIVLPVWLAETFVVAVVSVPAPSTASGGMSATRWATQGVEVESVAVLFPVAAGGRLGAVGAGGDGLTGRGASGRDRILLCQPWAAFCVAS